MRKSEITVRRGYCKGRNEKFYWGGGEGRREEERDCFMRLWEYEEECFDHSDFFQS